METIIIKIKIIQWQQYILNRTMQYENNKNNTMVAVYTTVEHVKASCKFIDLENISDENIILILKIRKDK